MFFLVCVCWIIKVNGALLCLWIWCLVVSTTQTASCESCISAGFYVVIISRSHVTGCFWACVWERACEQACACVYMTAEPGGEVTQETVEGRESCRYYAAAEGERKKDREERGQENHRQIQKKEWGERNRESNVWSPSRLLPSAAGLLPYLHSHIQNKCKHAVKMSQCLHRLVKLTFDYEMCLPCAHYKSSDTGFCLSRAFACSSSEPTVLVAVCSHHLSLAGCPIRSEWARTFLAVTRLSQQPR